MPAFLQNSCLPVVADESCVLEDNVAQMPGHFSGFNIKLVKCGGLTRRCAWWTGAAHFGLKVMVGCMLENQRPDRGRGGHRAKDGFADLDGSWLLRDDPFVAWHFRGAFSHRHCSRARRVAQGALIGTPGANCPSRAFEAAVARWPTPL